jgi:Flp pilus assembly protein TadD
MNNPPALTAVQLQVAVLLDSGSPMRRLLSTLAVLFLSLPLAFAGDLRIDLPKGSHLTPVQKLNREGVKAIEKHEYSHAKKLFYKAYLLDPDDPFTLNNLGYISELEGDVDRATRFYDLAQQQNSDAMVDISSSKGLKGETVAQVAGHADQGHMQVNSLNVQALGMLLKDRAPEADMILTRSQALDPKNPFTLNNLGYAKEKEGEYEKALEFYNQAAALHSNQPVVVTPNKDWRGKPISDVARENAKKVQQLVRKAQSDSQFRVAMLNLRGVSAINRNEPDEAKQDFQQANKLAPDDAFSLNNMGYLAEMQGDRETAQFYYDKAQRARRSGDRVDVATRKDAEGRRLVSVADVSESDVERQIAAEVAQRRAAGPPVLRHRNQPPAENPPSETPQQPQ